MGKTEPNAGPASRLLAGALVGIALLVLVGAGVYSEARGIDAVANNVGTERFETMSIDAREARSNIGPEAVSVAQQKSKPAPPAPPEPPQSPPQPDQPPQPAQAPQPKGPEPSQAPRPSQAPDPVTAPKPAQAPQPPAIGAGVGNGAGVGVGRGNSPGVGVGRGVGGGVGRGVGGGVGRGGPVAPATSASPATPATAPTAPTAPTPPAKKQEKSKTKSKEERSEQKSKEKADKGELIEAPHPAYPEEAKQQKIEGTVAVTITIGEDGNVIFAKAKSGPEPLYGASQDAAYKARFRPTMKDGKPVKVAAVMSYNFVLDKK